MEIVQYFAKEWAVIAAAPVTFIIAALLLMGLAYTAASWRFGGIIQSQRAQIELLDRKLSSVPGGADFERRKAIIEAIGKFLQRGNDLMASCRRYERPPPETDVEAWLDDLLGYIEANLGGAYVARVNDWASTPPGYMGQHRAHDALYNSIRVRVYHLQEFLKELAR